MPTDDEIAALERRVAKLEARPKDIWDKTAVITGALVPLAIALLSAVIAVQSERERKQTADAQEKARVEQRLAESREAQRRREVEERATEEARRVEQAKLLHAYIDTLVVADPVKRRIAIEGLLIGLPGHGPRLVKQLSEPGPGAVPGALEQLEASFPIRITKDLQLACRHRGSKENCIADTGLIYTAPGDGVLGILQAAIPAGSRKLVGTLSEFSGSSCNEGNARAAILIDGIEKWAVIQRQTANTPFAIDVPAEARMIEFRVDALGDGVHCDDPEWRDVRFTL